MPHAAPTLDMQCETPHRGVLSHDPEKGRVRRCVVCGRVERVDAPMAHAWEPANLTFTSSPQES